MNTKLTILERIKNYGSKDIDGSEYTEFLAALYDKVSWDVKNEMQFFQHAIEHIRTGVNPFSNSLTIADLMERVAYAAENITKSTFDKKLIYAHMALIAVSKRVISEMVKYGVIKEEEVDKLDKLFLYHVDKDTNVLGLSYAVGNELFEVHAPLDENSDAIDINIYHIGKNVADAKSSPVILLTSIPEDRTMTEELESLQEYITMNAYVSLLYSGIVKYDETTVNVTKEEVPAKAAKKSTKK